MGAKTHQVNLVGIRVEPNKQEVTLYMTLHIIGVITGKFMWIILLRNRMFRP